MEVVIKRETKKKKQRTTAGLLPRECNSPKAPNSRSFAVVNKINYYLVA